MKWKGMWQQLREHLELPYMLQRTDIPATEILNHMQYIEKKERWNIEHKKGPPPRCPNP